MAAISRLNPFLSRGAYFISGWVSRLENGEIKTVKKF
jgi:hypothetical protein